MLDETVPYEHSIRFVKEHNGTILHLVPDGHRLKSGRTGKSFLKKNEKAQTANRLSV